ncbi:MAG: T9SS type A sorting domain-containing protein [Ignavibacteriaceae bacterium]|nr:T9SS type A sorting domain-containing protein [Ignavibacteriaceae bacterium]
MHQECQEIFPTEMILYQNYPNPFNSSTVISYSITFEENISIKIYNSLGELIKTITNGLVRSGIHTVNLSSDDLPSGVYIYKLQTETKFLTKKLLIIK